MFPPDPAFSIDDENAPADSHTHQTHPVSRDDVAFFVREQRKTEALRASELFVAACALPRNTPHFGPQLAKRFEFVLIATQLGGAARRVIRGIKSQHNFVASPLRERKMGLLRLALHEGNAGKGKVWGGVANLGCAHENRR